MAHARDDHPTGAAIPEVHEVPEAAPVVVPGAGEPAVDRAGDVRPGPEEVKPVPTPSARPSKIKPTRISGTWVAVIVAIVVLAFLLVFILQNLDTVTVHFLGAEGSMPLAVAMLFAVIAGAALVALIGGARILQLRKQARRPRRR
ncbi:lipopolysaccharide assembly protein LapA domain-containing protein [Amycolatopsis sp. PS_44_ISF1]|uniref:LapA family protein n=1 Tax=Amycolatopsis sp. PS_44_ISF1 TaxID=2974917 RepID=UPI0028DD540A|nr:lipopolysaccharide assembly protein LapA domain-containing protein [Amycolatopsis sp. PS_44_ISF1]MDT8911050.1 lipopolysaccharide assembly protein LapA domain-containing protein [Amycolatopsis sp. PS_44_ISF1]